MGPNFKLLLDTLERSIAAQMKAHTTEIAHLRDKAENMSRIDATHEAMKEDIRRLYQSIKVAGDDSAGSIQRIHVRIDSNNTFLSEEVGKAHSALGHATNRIEHNLGDKVTDQGDRLTALKGDYDQKISAIKAVWSVLTFVLVLIQAAAGFVIRSYISSGESRLATLEAGVQDNQKRSQRIEDSVKELQNEVLSRAK